MRGLILMAFVVAMLGVTPARADWFKAQQHAAHERWAIQRIADLGTQLDEQCPEVCPKCPSAKTIAEQVREFEASVTRPTIIHCNKKAARQAVGGYLAPCRVFFPTAGTPPLVEE